MSLNELLKTFLEDSEVVREEARYVEKSKSGFSLKGMLQRGRLRMARERVAYKRGLTFRPSDLTYPFCERLKVLQLAGRLDILEGSATPKQQLIFDMGNAIHEILQGYFWDLGWLKGSYKCVKCDKIYDDLISPTACPSGIKSHTKKHLKYKEIKLVEPELNISGRCDGVLVIDGVEHLVDIKSIQNRTPELPAQAFCFEDLESKGPSPAHIVQLHLYMRMLNITDTAHLLYVGKNNHQIKTFAIPYDDTLLDPYLEKIRSLIKLGSDLRNAEVLPGTVVELPATCSREDCPCHEHV